MRDLDGDILSTGDLGVWDLGHVGVAGEVDGAVRGVLGHKGDGVGSMGGNCGRQEGDELGELHDDGCDGCECGVGCGWDCGCLLVGMSEVSR